MDNPRKKFWDEAADKEPTTTGKVMATILMACVAVAAIMLTVKLGMVLFS